MTIHKKKNTKIKIVKNTLPSNCMVFNYIYYKYFITNSIQMFFA